MDMDDNEFRDIDDQPEPEPAPARADREGIPWGAVFLLIWAVLLIVFSVQNADNTPVRFLGWAWDMPVALLVMVTALATLVVTGLGFAFYRRRRRQLRALKQSSRPSD